MLPQKCLEFGAKQGLITRVIFYIYLTTNDRLIYKTTSNDNDLEVGECNQYGHRLIYKASIISNSICEFNVNNGSGNL